MPTSTVTSKGQITLPGDVRTALGAEAGDLIEFVPVDGGYKLVVVCQNVERLRGRFAGRVARPFSIQEMDEAIVAASALRDAS